MDAVLVHQRARREAPEGMGEGKENNGARMHLHQWLSNFKESESARILVKTQIARSHPQSFWIRRFVVGLRLCTSNMVVVRLLQQVCRQHSVKDRMTTMGDWGGGLRLSCHG